MRSGGDSGARAPRAGLTAADDPFQFDPLTVGPAEEDLFGAHPGGRRHGRAAQDLHTRLVHHGGEIPWGRHAPKQYVVSGLRLQRFGELVGHDVDAGGFVLEEHGQPWRVVIRDNAIGRLRRASSGCRPRTSAALVSVLRRPGAESTEPSRGFSGPRMTASSSALRPLSSPTNAATSTACPAVRSTPVAARTARDPVASANCSSADVRTTPRRCTLCARRSPRALSMPATVSRGSPRGSGAARTTLKVH